MNHHKIGVFDSGVGGLTAIKAFEEVLPDEDVVYLGDTEHMPYGGRSFDTIEKFAYSNFNFMLSQDVKAIIVACGTISSVVLPHMGDNFKGVPVIGVVESAAEAAVSITKNKRIGLIATAASVKSGAYAESLKRKLPDAKVFANAAPMFVPLVENGRFNRGDRLALLAAEEYLAPLLENGIDTLILGCTHYPFLSDVISDICGTGVTLVNPAAETVKRAKDLLSEKGLLKQGPRRGETKFFVSSDIESFQTLATMFLGDTYNTIPTLIDIDRY